MFNMNQQNPAIAPQVKQRSLVHSTTTVSAMTMISRITGFFRDMVVAHMFGAVAAIDAFYVAFKIPNFLRRLFAEGSFSQAFVPVLAEYNQQRSHGEVQQFVNRMAGTLSVILFGVTLLAILVAPLLTLVFAPGFAQDPSRYDLATTMLRITFPYLLLISLTAFAGAILNSYGRFMVPAFTSVLLNVGMIIAAVFFAPFFTQPVLALAWGVFLGGIIQLLFQLPFLARIHLLPKLTLGFNDPGVRRVIKLMVPALFGVSVAQINVLVDTIFASFLKVGSVTWLYYSDRLMGFPIGVFGVALATVVLPNLARKHANNSQAAFAVTLDWSIRCILLVGLPAAVGLGVLAEPLFASLFQYGKFTPHDVVMAGYSLSAYALGVPFFMLIKTLASGFYAKQNIKTPVRIAVLAMIANTVLCSALIMPLAHVGLALATSLSAMLNTGMLVYMLWKLTIWQFQPGWWKFSLRLLFASTVMGLLLWFGKGQIADWFAWHSVKRGVHLLTLVTVAGLAYFGCLWLTGMRVRDFRAN